MRALSAPIAAAPWFAHLFLVIALIVPWLVGNDLSLAASAAALFLSLRAQGRLNCGGRWDPMSGSLHLALGVWCGTLFLLATGVIP